MSNKLRYMSLSDIDSDIDFIEANVNFSIFIDKYSGNCLAPSDILKS